MKKQIILCGLAAASLLAYASSEKIALTRNGSTVANIRVENLSNISYSGDEKGFNAINFNMSDGTVKSYNLDDFNRMEYSAPLPENPVQIEVTAHHTCATLTITAPDEGVYYRVTGKPESMLSEVDEEDWADYLIEADKEYVQYVADFYGRPLSSYSIEEVCEYGSQVRDWYPEESILDDTPIALVVYTAKIENDDLVLTTEPRLIRFKTKKYTIEDIRFTISTDRTSNSVTVKADGLPKDAPFAIELFSKSELETTDITSLMSSAANEYAAMIYQFDMDWPDFTYTGHGERTWTNKAVGEEYVAAVFGCEYGVITTYPTTLDVVIPEPEITDDCQFEVETTQLTPGEVSLKITPSKADTRYAAFLVSGERLASTTPSRYVGSQIKWYNNSNTIKWAEDKYVYTGETTITTHEGIVNGLYLQAGEEYYVLICGLTSDGTRTTELKEVKIVTTADEEKDPLTFEVDFGPRKLAGSVAMQTITVIPSDKETKFVIENLPSTNTYADLSFDDEEFIQRYLEVQEKYLTLYTGDTERTISYQKEWNFSTNANEWGKNIVFIFGYDGVVTSPLYVYEIDTETGNVKQLRGPGSEPVEE